VRGLCEAAAGLAESRTAPPIGSDHGTERLRISWSRSSSTPFALSS